MLFDFLVEELAHREPVAVRRIRPVRVALQNQRDDLLAFASVVDAKMAETESNWRSSASASSFSDFGQTGQVEVGRSNIA